MTSQSIPGDVVACDATACTVVTRDVIGVYRPKQLPLDDVTVRDDTSVCRRHCFRSMTSLSTSGDVTLAVHVPPFVRMWSVVFTEHVSTQVDPDHEFDVGSGSSSRYQSMKSTTACTTQHGLGPRTWTQTELA